MIVAVIVAAIALAALGIWYRLTRPRDVPCAIDLEATQAHFHAHVALDGFDPDPGDQVLVHGAPTRIPLGSQRHFRSHATVLPASWPKRQWVRLTGGIGFQELYDVGFEG